MKFIGWRLGEDYKMVESALLDKGYLVENYS